MGLRNSKEALLFDRNLVGRRVAGPIFRAWEMIREASLFKGEKDVGQSRLQRSVCVLQRENVEYLVVGAHAVIYYSEPRYTKDLDIWINPSHENALKAMAALTKFGAPLSGVTEKILPIQK